jgi:hypothetical protein
MVWMYPNTWTHTYKKINILIKPNTRNSPCKLSLLQVSLSLAECNHQQVQKTVMTSGTCKGKLEIHKCPPIYASTCTSKKDNNNNNNNNNNSNDNDDEGIRVYKYALVYSSAITIYL